MIEISLQHPLADFALEADIALEPRGITGVIGPSGAGKSTLFSLLAGHMRPHSGRISLNGRLVFDSALGIDQAPAKRGIGLVFQEGLLFPHMSVERNLAYGARNRGTAYWGEVIAALELQHLLKTRPARLSGGERQRVAIARALMAEPELLLLDEPVSALDAGLKARTLDLIDQVHARTQIPMIYISHAAEEIRRLCQSVITVAKGKVALADGQTPLRPTPAQHAPEAPALTAVPGVR